MSADPPVREDGRCALDSCGRKLSRPKHAKRYASHWLELDPFCSRRCCEVYYGLSEPMTEYEAVRSKSGQVNADRYRASRAETARY